MEQKENMNNELKNLEEVKRLLKENSSQGLSCTCRYIAEELLNEEETELEEYDENWDVGKREKKYSHVVMDFRIPKWIEKKFYRGNSYNVIKDTLKNVLINMIRCEIDGYDFGEYNAICGRERK